MPDKANVFERIGVQRIINATGTQTRIGGGVRLSPRTLQAVKESREYYVDVNDLLSRSNAMVADLLGTEAALITSGAFAALVLGAASMMTGTDPKRVAQLPDPAGMRSEFLIQTHTRYSYDRCISVAGGRLVEIGDEYLTTVDQIKAGIGPNTAGILYPAIAETRQGTVPLVDVIEIAKAYGIGVLVDAAGEVFPIERMRHLAQSNSSLVCFSGKYFWDNNSTGILCGQNVTVNAAQLNSFMSYHTIFNDAMGAGYKVDCQSIVGLLTGLEDWLEMDHVRRINTNRKRLETIAEGIRPYTNIKIEIVEENSRVWDWLKLSFDESVVQQSSKSIEKTLAEGDPPIWIWRNKKRGSMLIAAHTLRDGEEYIVRDRLSEVFSAQTERKMEPV